MFYFLFLFLFIIVLVLLARLTKYEYKCSTGNIDNWDVEDGRLCGIG